MGFVPSMPPQRLSRKMSTVWKPWMLLKPLQDPIPLKIQFPISKDRPRNQFAWDTGSLECVNDVSCFESVVFRQSG